MANGSQSKGKQPVASPSSSAFKWVQFNGCRATEVAIDDDVRNVGGLIKAAYKELMLEREKVAYRHLELYRNGWDETTKPLRPGLPVGQVEDGDTDLNPLQLVGPEVPATGGAAGAGGGGAFAISSHPVRVT